MWRSNIRFRDEPWITVLAYVLLLFSFAVIVLAPRHVIGALGPRSLQLCLPFILIAPGVMAMRRLAHPRLSPMFCSPVPSLRQRI